MSKSIFLVFNLLQQDIFIYPSKKRKYISTQTSKRFKQNVKAFEFKRLGVLNQTKRHFLHVLKKPQFFFIYSENIHLKAVF